MTNELWFATIEATIRDQRTGNLTVHYHEGAIQSVENHSQVRPPALGPQPITERKDLTPIR